MHSGRCRRSLLDRYNLIINPLDMGWCSHINHSRAMLGGRSILGQNWTGICQFISLLIEIPPSVLLSHAFTCGWKYKSALSNHPTQVEIYSKQALVIWLYHLSTGVPFQFSLYQIQFQLKLTSNAYNEATLKSILKFILHNKMTHNPVERIMSINSDPERIKSCYSNLKIF